MLERKRTLAMNWDDLGDEDDDDFFESNDRLSVVNPSDLALSDSDEDDDDAFQDTLMPISSMKRGSFGSYAAHPTIKRGSFRAYAAAPTTGNDSIRYFPPAPSARRDSFRYFPPSPSVRRDFAPIPTGNNDAFPSFALIPSARHDFDAPNYDMWMAAPDSIRERRKKLFAGMGLDSNKDLLKQNSKMFSREISRKLSSMPVIPPPTSPTPALPKPAAKVEVYAPDLASVSTTASVAASASASASVAASTSATAAATASSPTSASTSTSASVAVTASVSATTSISAPLSSTSSSLPPAPPGTPPEQPSHGEVAPVPELQLESHETRVLVELVRSRSDGDIDWDTHDAAKMRKDELLGEVSKYRLTRTYSEIATHARFVSYVEHSRMVAPPSRSQSPTRRKSGPKPSLSSSMSTDRLGAFFLIKNLDTGKEFVVNEYDQNGMWNKFSDLQTGKKLTMEEFEKSVGYSPIVKELMRRQNKDIDNGFMKFAQNSYISKSIKLSKQRGAALLKNISSNLKDSIKIGEKDNPPPSPKGNKSHNSSQWIKVKHTGKMYKDLSALHLCQEIQAHEGSIWTMRFSLDGRYLASAGEDTVIRIWEVQECEIMLKMSEEGSATPHHSTSTSSAHPSLGEAQQLPSEKKKKPKAPFFDQPVKAPFGKDKKGAPEYAQVPETVFALSEKPICSFEGHTEDVLDLSWSKSLKLLSSSMDKTVRLWDLKTKSCVKTFTHSDYVTCIHFNPIDDNIFISGSLDEKVRMWDIRHRRLVSYTNIYEMVTAVSYSPDGQEALIGTHKGNCRVFSTEDCVLEEKKMIETQKKKNQPKKITGFQFSPWNPSEVLVTSADSRIRILDDKDVVHKFIGFRNTSSQIAASFGIDGKYVICASEDSQVYCFRREEVVNTGPTKGKPYLLTRSFEHFSCKDVSVAITWACGTSNESAPKEKQPKKHASNNGEDPPNKEEGKSKLPPIAKKGAAEAHGHDHKGGSKGSKAGDSEGSAHGSNPLWSPNWHWLQDGNKQQHGDKVSAWGMVIVTAGLEGEIRAYQNFGHPRKLGGLQTGLPGGGGLPGGLPGTNLF